MTLINHSLDVDVPLQTAYNQWTQFESFPQFTTGVERVEQVNDTKTHWVVKILGVEREFDAEITEQHPDEWIGWKTEGGLVHSGEVIFNRVTDSTTQVSVQVEYEPQDFMETVGDELGIVAQRLQTDMKRFKEFIESRDGEQGAWRGAIGSPEDGTT